MSSPWPPVQAFLSLKVVLTLGPDTSESSFVLHSRDCFSYTGYVKMSDSSCSEIISSSIKRLFCNFSHPRLEHFQVFLLDNFLFIKTHDEFGNAFIPESVGCLKYLL